MGSGLAEFCVASEPLRGGFFLGVGGGGDKPERPSQSDSQQDLSVRHLTCPLLRGTSPA